MPFVHSRNLLITRSAIILAWRGLARSCEYKSGRRPIPTLISGPLVVAGILHDRPTEPAIQLRPSSIRKARFCPLCCYKPLARSPVVRVKNHKSPLFTLIMWGYFHRILEPTLISLNQKGHGHSGPDPLYFSSGASETRLNNVDPTRRGGGTFPRALFAV